MQVSKQCKHMHLIVRESSSAWFRQDLKHFTEFKIYVLQNERKNKERYPLYGEIERPGAHRVSKLSFKENFAKLIVLQTNTG